MSSTNNEVGVPLKTSSAVAKSTDGTCLQGMAAPSTGQTSCLSRPGAVARGKSQRGNSNHNGKAGSCKPIARGSGNQKSAPQSRGKDFTADQIERQVAVFKNTALYVRGRDQVYPDALALARFNQWVGAHQAEIDPSEQKVCIKCGQVDFTLCAHSIREAPVDVQQPAPVVVPNNLRHHEWTFRPIQSLKEAFRWPGFDTHSQSDARLHGFSNHHLPDDLIIPELFSYLTLNMQTSYLVNGYEDRALRLSHVHRLAQKWVITKNLEEAASCDQHYCVRIKLTIQRACDNAQNQMLYAERDPARNFGLAWLPGSRVKQLMLLLVVVVALWHFSTTMGLVLRFLEVIWYFAGAVLYILRCVAASVPDLVPKLITSVSAHQSGKEQSFQCVSTDYDMRWYAPAGDAHAVIQSCNFTDWVMAGLTEASYQSLETLDQVSSGIRKSKDDFCGRVWLELAGYKIIWAGDKLAKAIEMGQLGPLDVLRLWVWTLWAEIRLLVFRC